MSGTPYIGKAVFYFVAALPYKLFQIGYFIFSFPCRLRHLRRYKNAPKEITFRRITGTHSVLSAVDAVHALREVSGQVVVRPSIFGLLEDLWNESMSEDWKLPTVSELEAIRNALLVNIDQAPVSEVGASRLLIWAIDDSSHMFVLFNPHTGKVTDTHPRNLRVVFRGEAPDSREKHVAYAVSVRAVYTA